MHSLIIGVSGIRGIVGKGLTPEVACAFASTFGAFCGSGEIFVGRDTRGSGEMLRLSVLSGLISVGADVVDLGIVPTPTVLFNVRREGAAGGIAITASHNPIPWNGLKFVGSSGIFLDEEEGAEFLKQYAGGWTQKVSWNRLGHLRSDANAVQRHIQAIVDLDLIHVEEIRARRFRVVLDSVNGAGSVAGPLLLKELGCEVIPLNDRITGRFAHDPEPTPDHLTDLCAQVKIHEADIGFANDPDADRLAIVSEKAIPIGEEYTLALAAKFVLGKRPGPMVANLSTSQMVEDIARRAGVDVHRTPVGEVNVVRTIQATGAVIGGEGNGGVILPALHLGRDALVGMALSLQYLAETGATVTELTEELPRYVILKRKYRRPGLDKDQALAAVRSTYEGKEEMDLRDGVKLIRGSTWIHLRKSNTEPILRAVMEAGTPEEVEEVYQEVIDLLDAL